MTPIFKDTIYSVKICEIVMKELMKMPLVILHYLIFMNLIFIPIVYSQCDGATKTVLATHSPGHLSLPLFEKVSKYRVMNCSWRIEVEDSDMSVLFNVLHHNMTCPPDDLYLTSSDVNITTLCESDNMDSYVTKMTASINVLLSITISSSEDKYFTMWYLGTNNIHTDTVCSSPSTLIPTDEKQYITSPAFPDNYPTSMACEVELTSPDPANDVMVEILYNDMEPHVACRYDFLQVTKYYTYLLYQRRICENNSFKRSVYKGRKIKLAFRSDTSTVGRGFLASYSLVNKDVRECKSGISDLVFLVDSSNSVGWGNFRVQLGFMMEILSRFNITKDGLHVSIVTFADDVISQFWLNEYFDTDSAVNAIKTITYSDGSTQTAKALKFVRNKTFCTCQGARLNSTKTLIVITDGLSVDPQATGRAARNLHNDEIRVIAIGISNYDEEELSSLASDKNFVFRLHSFGALTTILTTLQDTICSIVGDTVSNLWTNTASVTTVKDDSSEITVTQNTEKIAGLGPATMSTMGMTLETMTTELTLSTMPVVVPQEVFVQISTTTMSLRNGIPHSEVTSGPMDARTSTDASGWSSVLQIASATPTSTSSTNLEEKYSKENQVAPLNPYFRKLGIHDTFLSPLIVWSISISSVITFFVVTSCCCFWVLVWRRRRRNRRKRIEDVTTWHIFSKKSQLDNVSIFGEQRKLPLRHINYIRRSSLQVPAQ